MVLLKFSIQMVLQNGPPKKHSLLQQIQILCFLLSPPPVVVSLLCSKFSNSEVIIWCRRLVQKNTFCNFQAHKTQKLTPAAQCWAKRSSEMQLFIVLFTLGARRNFGATRATLKTLSPGHQSNSTATICIYAHLCYNPKKHAFTLFKMYCCRDTMSHVIWWIEGLCRTRIDSCWRIPTMSVCSHAKSSLWSNFEGVWDGSDEAMLATSWSSLSLWRKCCWRQRYKPSEEYSNL